MKENFTYSSSTGKTIFAKEWKDETKEQYNGIVQIVHGMKEQGDQYEELANFLAKEGYIVVVYDQLGHGNTIPKQDYGFFAEKDGWIFLAEDVHLLYQIEKEKYSNLPYIIYAHSMGSVVARTYLAKYQDDIQGIILSGISGQRRKLTLGINLIKIMKLFYGKRYRSRLIEYLVMGTLSKKSYLEKREEKGKTFTLQAYEDLLKGMRYGSKIRNMKQMNPNIPILLLSGDKDPVGERAKGVIRVSKQMKKAGVKEVSIRLFHGVRHNILKEENKEKVYFIVKQWLNKEIGKGEKK